MVLVFMVSGGDEVCAVALPESESKPYFIANPYVHAGQPRRYHPAGADLWPRAYRLYVCLGEWTPPTSVSLVTPKPSAGGRSGRWDPPVGMLAHPCAQSPWSLLWQARRPAVTRPDTTDHLRGRRRNRAPRRRPDV